MTSPFIADRPHRELITPLTRKRYSEAEEDRGSVMEASEELDRKAEVFERALGGRQ